MRYVEFMNLYTPRLCLRKLDRSDVPLYYARLGSSADVTKYMLFSPHSDISESACSIERTLRRYAEGKCYRFCIALKESNELIGVIEPLRFDEDKSSCSFAYMLGRDFWGQGYGTEALGAVLDFLFRDMELALVQADHMESNAASGAVMRKAGMTYQGTISGAYEKDGVLHNAPQYAITRSQWFAK